MQRSTIRTQAAVSVKAMATQRKSGSAKKSSAPSSAGAVGRTLWLPNTVRRRRCGRGRGRKRRRWRGWRARGRIAGARCFAPTHPSQELCAQACCALPASLIAARSRRPPRADRAGVAGRLPAGCVAAPARSRPILFLTRQRSLTHSRLPLLLPHAARRLPAPRLKGDAGFDPLGLSKVRPRAPPAAACAPHGGAECVAALR
jgi:hypothetical protein